MGWHLGQNYFIGWSEDSPRELNHLVIRCTRLSDAVVVPSLVPFSWMLIGIAFGIILGSLLRLRVVVPDFSWWLAPVSGEDHTDEPAPRGSGRLAKKRR